VLRLSAPLAVTACVLALLPGCDASASDRGEATTSEPGVTASWGPTRDAPFPGSLAGDIAVPASPATVLTVRLRNARFTAVPAACEPSSIVRRRSRIIDANTALLCALPESRSARTVHFEAVAAGAEGDEMGGTVRDRSGDLEAELPTIEIQQPPASLSPRLRLVSSPDFLNADVGDLRKGPGFWTRKRSANSINAAYRRTLGAVLKDWAATRPDGVLVAGDLVEGHWGTDDLGTGNFGPVRTLAEQRAAIDRAARTYYPQYLRRFRQHGLSVFPAPGDHEYGDNPWPAAKRARATALRQQFARYFTTRRNGAPVFPDHPRGPHALTAYAGRPLPDVQVISIDPFDITPDRARLGLDRQQRTWLRGVLRRAVRDHVRWIVVQGHVPILGPVRTRGSSGLTLPGGARSKVWRMFEKYGVDLYLSGEAHDVTVLEHGGVTQVTHGGLFAYGLTNALLLDFYDDYVYVSLRDYDIREDNRGPRLWQTRDDGIPARIEMKQAPFVIGTGVVPERGGMRHETGVLVPRSLSGPQRLEERHALTLTPRVSAAPAGRAGRCGRC